jgi:hypothetical protein
VAFRSAAAEVRGGFTQKNSAIMLTFCGVIGTVMLWVRVPHEEG